MPLLRKLFVIAATITCQASAFGPQSLLSNRRGREASLSASLSSRTPPPPPLRLVSQQHRAAIKPPLLLRSSPLSRRLSATSLHGSRSPDDENDASSEVASSCWNPDLRKRLAVLSSLGFLETSYLAYDKLGYSASGGKTSLVGALCSSAAEGATSSCGDVLHGPYASLHVGGAEVPLSLLGAVSYAAVFALATAPLLSSANGESEDDEAAVLDGDNRIALLGVTTLMASFSVYLVSLLVGVLHASCTFCFASATLSVAMAASSWYGGALPNPAEGDAAELRKTGVIAGASSVGVATVAALGLFLGVSGGDYSDSPSAAYAGTLLASTSTSPAVSFAENVPPRITTKSSPAALALASDLRSLDSRMFGAFWCSHCYDQKQAMGYDAMQIVPYVECDREGYNNQRALCKERELPGYPTWEIGGKLFPGERSLEELREIVDDVKAGR